MKHIECDAHIYFDDTGEALYLRLASSQSSCLYKPVADGKGWEELGTVGNLPSPELLEQMIKAEKA